MFSGYELNTGESNPVFLILYFIAKALLSNMKCIKSFVLQ